ncbi:MAG TPA: SGNH/GDSL hydrolase family protein [Burkholderiaceae bacterium]|nr:SGNH/GDSL hydrolase family protein [Burkholderiaceae bacterium]
MTAHLPAAHRLEPSARTGLSRRGVLRGGLALGTASLLAACGSGDVVSAINPSRFIAFGDGLSDVGQAGSRYTVNDGTINIWAEHVASRYGKTLSAQSKGGLGFAQGHGPTEALPRTLAAQIDAFLASNTFQTDDVVLINLPMADVLAPVAAVKAGTLTETAALAQVDTHGNARADDMKRLIAAGAKHIVVCGVYDLSRSPFAAQQDQKGLFSLASLRLNDAFKLAAVNLGANLLFVDAAFLVNRNADDKTGPAFGFANRTTALCTTPTAFSCNDSTLASTSKASYLFADNLHLTPNGHLQLGDYAYLQLHSRW